MCVCAQFKEDIIFFLCDVSLVSTSFKRGFIRRCRHSASFTHLSSIYRCTITACVVKNVSNEVISITEFALLAGHRGQRSDEEEEEGEVEEDEEEVVKKSSEKKDSDGEAAKAEKKEAGDQVWFAPITRRVCWSRELNADWSVLVGCRLITCRAQRESPS